MGFKSGRFSSRSVRWRINIDDDGDENDQHFSPDMFPFSSAYSPTIYSDVNILVVFTGERREEKKVWDATV